MFKKISSNNVLLFYFINIPLSLVCAPPPEEATEVRSIKKDACRNE
jgi:hypothetical protein